MKFNKPINLDDIIDIIIEAVKEKFLLKNLRIYPKNYQNSFITQIINVRLAVETKQTFLILTIGNSPSNEHRLFCNINIWHYKNDIPFTLGSKLLPNLKIANKDGITPGVPVTVELFMKGDK